jgi:hypothetical protein
MSVVQYVGEITATPATGTGPYANVFHIFTGTPSVARANAHIGALKTFYTTLVGGAFPTSSSVLLGRVVTVVDANPPVYIPATSQTVTGTNGTGYLAPQVCAVISWKSSVATRKGRGRTYIGPLAAAMGTSAGNFAAGNLALIQSAASALITAITAIDPADYLCIYHRPPKGTAPNPASDNTPILSATVANVPHVQRRRGS